MNKSYHFDIIGNILKDSLWNSTVSKIIGIIATLATISGFTLKEIFKDSSALDWLNWSYTVCIGLVILILRILWVAAREINGVRFSKLASYTPLKMTRNIRDLVACIDGIMTNQITSEETLELFCNKLREIFDKLTNSHCCVSIKVIEGNADGSFTMGIDEIINHRVHNVARDNNHRSRDTEAYRNAEHYIRANTAFSTIVGCLGKNPKRYYLNNNVDSSNSYETTSPYQKGDNDSIYIPYKSEVVFAIMDKAPNNTYEFVGFLCIDSEIEHAFDKESASLEIAAMVANSLFWILKRINQT